MYTNIQKFGVNKIFFFFLRNSYLHSIRIIQQNLEIYGSICIVSDFEILSFKVFAFHILCR